EGFHRRALGEAQHVLHGPHHVGGGGGGEVDDGGVALVGGHHMAHGVLHVAADGGRALHPGGGVPHAVGGHLQHRVGAEHVLVAVPVLGVHAEAVERLGALDLLDGEQ